MISFSERFDMVREMRQSGLLHGFEVAGKGFIDISRSARPSSLPGMIRM